MTDVRHKVTAPSGHARLTPAVPVAAVAPAVTVAGRRCHGPPRRLRSARRRSWAARGFQVTDQPHAAQRAEQLTNVHAEPEGDTTRGIEWEKRAPKLMCGGFCVLENFRLTCTERVAQVVPRGV